MTKSKQLNLEGRNGVFWKIRQRLSHLGLQSGKKNPFYGKHHIDAAKQKMSREGTHHTEASKQKISKAGLGEKNHMYGKHHTEEAKQRMSEANIGLHVGEKNEMYDVPFCLEKHWNWQGGISKLPYSLDFNRILKQEINARDNFTCQVCHEEENGRVLVVHHIDYNKKNSNPWNLIALCRSCHMKTNFNREEWINFFSVNMAQRELL